MQNRARSLLRQAQARKHPSVPSTLVSLNPQVPLSVRHSRAAVHVLQQKPAAPFPDPSHMVGAGVAVWQGITQGELLRAVEPIKEAAVLVFRWGLRHG